MEEEIERILDESYVDWRLKPFLALNSWGEGPISVVYSTSVHVSIWSRIDSIIKNADLALCLTSKYLYIRECRKYYGK